MIYVGMTKTRSLKILLKSFHENYSDLFKKTTRYVIIYFHISKGTTEGIHYTKTFRTLEHSFSYQNSIRTCQHSCRKCRHCGKFVWYPNTKKCACISFRKVFKDVVSANNTLTQGSAIFLVERATFWLREPYF